MGDGKALGTAQADQNGEWSLATEEKLASADPKLELKTKSAAQVQKEREEQARLAALSPQPTPIPPEARSAGAVASHLLKDLEGMVKDARTTRPPPAAGADTAAPTNLAAAPPPSEPGVHKSVPVPITFIQTPASTASTGSRYVPYVATPALLIPVTPAPFIPSPIAAPQSMTPSATAYTG